MKVTRYERSRLDGTPEKTPHGFLKVGATLTRSGVFVYRNPDGSPRREWRPASEVMKADSLASLISAPVTAGHPLEMVTADNRSKYDRGNVGDEIIRDGGKVRATVYVKDGKLIAAVERGDAREMSCGYTCDMEDTAGVVPAGEPDEGQRYDAIQRNIAYNHAAVVKVGRAGSSVRLHLDGAGNEVADGDEPFEEKSMKIEKIDGVEYEVGTEAHKAAETRRDEAAKAAKAQSDALQARADAAEAERDRLKKDLADMPAKIAEQATARAALETSARKVLGEKTKLDGLDDAAIRRQVAAKAHPELKLDGKSDAYVESLFDLAVAKTDSGAEELKALRGSVERGDSGEGEGERVVKIDAEDAYQKMLDRELNRWKKPADKAKA